MHVLRLLQHLVGHIPQIFVCQFVIIYPYLLFLRESLRDSNFLQEYSFPRASKLLHPVGANNIVSLICTLLLSISKDFPKVTNDLFKLFN